MSKNKSRKNSKNIISSVSKPNPSDLFINSITPQPLSPAMAEYASILQKGNAIYNPNYRLIQERDEVGQKSIIIDPFGLQGNGYVQKNGLDHHILRNMSRTHIVRAIIETRKEQVSNFCQPQSDKYSPGFVFRRKKKFFGDVDLELTDSDKVVVQWLTDFIMNCGSGGSKWDGDTFDVFTSKFIEDSLVLDAASAEIVYNRKGYPAMMQAVDGSTIRLADTYDSAQRYSNVKLIKGYPPKYVQLIDGSIKNEYWSWELMYGIRNPSSDYRTMGYGRSELEDLITTVTNLLNADQYNGNYFKSGSNPNSIFVYKGAVNPSVINNLRNDWSSQMAGVANMHKTPFINAENLEIIKTHESNRDMEYSSYQEFLIKICCALYLIDPSEIGFHLSGGSEQKVSFDGNNAARLKQSRDKGLVPLLRYYQKWINKHIVEQLSPDFEFVFVGLSEKEELADLESDIKLLGSFMTLNEIRQKNGLPPLEKGGDLILNSIYTSAINNQDQMQQQQQILEQQNNQQTNPFNKFEPDKPDDSSNKDVTNNGMGDGSDNQNNGMGDDDNPIQKALLADLPKLFNKCY